MGGLSKLNLTLAPFVKTCGCLSATFKASALKYCMTCRNSSEVGPRAIFPAFVCMAGRPAQPMSLEAQSAYFTAWNGNCDASQVPSCSEIGCYFITICGLHLTFHTPRYLKRQPVKSLSCRQCLHEAGQKQFGLPVSSHEAYAWQTVRSLFRGHMLVEISVLGKRFAKADIWLPFDQTGQVKLNLVIQVDGEGHTCYPMQGRSVAEQQSRDASFNAECWKRDLKLLRLHHADKREWPACVCYAILRCLCKPDVTFRCWTSSYSQASIRSMSGMLHGN